MADINNKIKTAEKNVKDLQKVLAKAQKTLRGLRSKVDKNLKIMQARKIACGASYQDDKAYKNALKDHTEADDNYIKCYKECSKAIADVREAVRELNALKKQK